jgi:hypothetical protein
VTVQFLNAASYPTITVEIGVSDSTSSGGTWGQSTWGFTATSATSLTIGTGSKTLTTQSGLSISAGQTVLVASTATPGNYMLGTVTSYSTTTLVVNITSTGGSGTVAAWTLTFNNAGTWTDNIAWTDISDYVRALSTDWARSRELNRQPANVLNLTLDNRDGRFSPGNTAGPFVVAGVSKIRPRIAVRVRATWSGTTYPIYYGFVTNWQDNLPFVGKDMIATVQATDALSLLTLNAVDGSVIGSNGDSCSTRVAAILTAARWRSGRCR